MGTHWPPEVASSRPSPAPRRPAWRRRLVEAERGIVQGVRGDSTLFVHFFGGSLVLAAGLVLHLALWQWTTVILALTLVLSAEIFCQVLKTLSDPGDGPPADAAVKAQRLATAAVFVTLLGALLVLALIFGERLRHLLGPS